MFKNGLVIVIGISALLVVTMAVSTPRSNGSLTTDRGLDDFHQRHPDWTWTIRNDTGSSTPSDYFQRHLELTVPSVLGLGASDYFIRHPELTTPILSLEASDYFQRHPGLTVPSTEVSIDLTDYFFRHPASLPSSTNIDLTDYFFRHS